jgi:hypothetical protein
LNYVETVGDVEVENASTFVTTVGTGTWAVDGTWKETLTPGGTDVFSGTGAANLPMAVASGGPASLKRLAYDITGNQNNWSQIGVPGGSTEPNDPDEVKPGTEVDVSKLLADLDVQVRGEVVSAARVKVKNATFGNTPAGTLSAAQIGAIFGPGSGTGPGYDCGAMVLLEFAEGLIKALGTQLYGRMRLNPTILNNQYMASCFNATAAEKGDWLVFWNNANVPQTSAWRDENVVCTVPGSLFYGWGPSRGDLSAALGPSYKNPGYKVGAELTFGQWMSMLAYEGGNGAARGWIHPARQFLDIAKLGELMLPIMEANPTIKRP